MNRLRIAWFTPIAKDEIFSISEYCTSLLLPYFTDAHEIEVFTDSLNSEICGLKAFHYLNAFQRHREKAFDIFFYQLEDSPCCRFIRAHCGLVPGVLWAHDVFMRDLGPEAYHTSPWEQSIRQFYDASESFSDRSIAPHQLWPRIYRESSVSPVVLFSSRWAQAEFATMVSTRLESYGNQHSVEYLPTPVELGSDQVGRSGSDCREMKIAYHGLPGLEGRCHKFLPALKAMEKPFRCTWMVPIGTQMVAERLVAEFGLRASQIEIVESVSPTAWRRLAEESHVAVHFHAGAFGRLAPYLQISYAVGCPVVVLNSGSSEELSDQAAFHIESGVFETEQIRRVLCRIQEIDRAQLGKQSKAYAGANWDVKSVATHLENLLSNYAPSVNLVMNKWEALRKRGQTELLREVQSLAAGSQRVPFDPYSVALAPALRELGWTS